MTGGRGRVALALVVLTLGAGFVWGYQAHRVRLFPHPIVSWLLPDREPKPYSWVRPNSRPLKNLRSLSYVGSTFDPESERRGVQLHDPERAWPGLNFYYSGFDQPFLLIDMEGRELFRWTDADRLLAHAELLPDGSLVVVRFDHSVARLDRDSEVLWETATRAHHDVWVQGDDLWVQSRRERLRPEVHPTQLTLEDSVMRLSLRDGAIVEEFSLLDVVLDSPYAFLLASVAERDYSEEDGPLDILHTNHIEVFDGTLAHLSPLFGAGNLLLSMRHLNAILILDGSSREVLWAWGPSNVYGQHHPSLLESGRILLFDNNLVTSRVLELDPLTGRIEWSWTDESFHTPLRGSVQRLPNGNTLVSESDTGYVLEVASDGDVVWEFANPDVTESGERGVIWRMWRFDPAELSFLDPR